MPSSALVHGAVFAVGAVVGAGAAAVVVGRQQQRHVPPVLPPPKPTAPIEVKKADYAGVVESATVPPGGILKYGNPGPITDLLLRKAYVVGYDRRLRHPAWTAEHLTRATLGRSSLEPRDEDAGGDRSKSIFVEDESLPGSFRSRLADYFRSGYDRGHMVPAADAKISQEAMDETFLLSNIAPQVGDGFNRHYWAYLERWCRNLTLSFSDVYIFTIPLYLPKKGADGKWRVTYEMIGDPPNVGVPTHFAKVVLTSRPVSPSSPLLSEVSAGAFVLPNAQIPDEAPLEGFVVPIDAVEKAAGLQLFSDEIKTSSRHICQSTRCQVEVKRFDNAQKTIGKREKGQTAIAASNSR